MRSSSSNAIRPTATCSQWDKQFRHNVAFNGWAERYDRSMAERALLKRKKREETDHEADLRRRRAEVEFQVWFSGL